MKVQAEEESFHAHKFFDYILERGGKVELLEIEKPICEFESVLDVFEKTLKHEVYITSCINSLMDVAEEIRDRAAVSFLQWFLEEQIEEESTAENIIAQLKLAEGCSKDILFMLDKEMASRTFSKPQ